jgi:hypothetical protein
MFNFNLVSVEDRGFGLWCCHFNTGSWMTLAADVHRVDEPLSLEQELGHPFWGPRISEAINRARRLSR